MNESKRIVNELSTDTWKQIDKDTKESVMQSLDNKLIQSFKYKIHLSLLEDLLDVRDSIYIDSFNMYESTDYLGIYHKLKFDPSVLCWIYEYSVILIKD